MSAILLANPFAAPPLQSQQSTAGSPLAAVPAQQVPSPPAGTNANLLSNGFGTGSGTSKQAENVALFEQSGGLERPPAATGQSVVNAQVQQTGGDADGKTPLGPDLPEVNMPDPLPTSPFLKGAHTSEIR